MKTVAFVGKESPFYDKEAQNFLSHPLINKDLSVETRRALDKKELKLTDDDIFVRVKINGKSGIFDLVTNQTVERLDENNLHHAMLPALVNHISKNIKVSYGQGATAGAVKFGNVYSTCDNALRNARIVVKIGNDVKYRRRIDSMLVEKEAEGPDANIFENSNWKLFPAEKKWTIQLEFPEEMSVVASDATPANDLWFEFRSKGSNTEPR